MGIAESRVLRIFNVYFDWGHFHRRCAQPGAFGVVADLGIFLICWLCSCCLGPSLWRCF